MRRLKSDLTRAQVCELFDYDPETGVFRHRFNSRKPSAWNLRYAGRPAGGTDGYGYLVVKIDGRFYALHRLAWLIVTGEWPARLIDHRDLNRKNNRFLNLRQADEASNRCNSGTNRNNKSGFKGVSWNRNAGRWEARIGVKRKLLFLGLFLTAEAAAKAYEEAAREYHGEFARAA